jgi:hypothetical protein
MSLVFMLYVPRAFTLNNVYLMSHYLVLVQQFYAIRVYSIRFCPFDNLFEYSVIICYCIFTLRKIMLINLNFNTCGQYNKTLILSTIMNVYKSVWLAVRT